MANKGARNYKGKESEQSKKRRKKKKISDAEDGVKLIRKYGNKLPTRAGAPKKKKLRKK